MKKTLPLLLCASLTFSCGENNSSNEVSKNQLTKTISNDKLKEDNNLMYYNEKPFSGISEIYDEHGGLWKQWNYNNGKKDGLFRRWYENGELKWSGNYKDGKEHGEWKRYRSDGTLETIILYKNGEIISEEYINKVK